MRFLLLGAGEFLPWSGEAEKDALAEAPKGHVVVLPTASAPEGDAVFERWAAMGMAHYAELGVEARVVNLRTREDASNEELISQLRGASMFFFSGGNPLYLARVLEESPLLEAIKAEMVSGAVFAGCSAGAMVVGARVEQQRGPAFWYVGLGLIPDVRFGVHWNRMPGFLPGLKEFVVSGTRRGQHFVGIDEGTAISGDGTHWRVFGSGGVDVRSSGRRARYRQGDEFTLDG